MSKLDVLEFARQNNFPDGLFEWYMFNRLKEIMYSLGYTLESGDDWVKYNGVTESESIIQIDNDFNITDFFVSPNRIFNMEYIVNLQNDFTELEKDITVINKEIQKAKDIYEEEKKKCQI